MSAGDAAQGSRGAHSSRVPLRSPSARASRDAGRSALATMKARNAARSGRRARHARALLLGATVLALGCGREREHPVSDTSELRRGTPSERVVELVPRTPYLATYPCSDQCHDAREPDATPRELVTFHAGRRVAHGPAIHWCNDCHSLDEPDHLVALDGETAISFDASDRLCAQCHGEKHRDWSEGIHALQTGAWRGTVQRRLCTACHDPHAPGRIQLEALPPPEPDPRVSGEPS